jgi:GTP-binding protein
MHHRGPTTTHGNGAGTGKERRLTPASFIGSFPAADFRLPLDLPQVALVGRSNVGKSSLLNRIIGRRSLAHTSKTPGKTRMLNVYEIDATFYLVDLPGYGFAKVSKAERAGFSKLITAYLSMRQDLIGVVWLMDIRRDPSREDLRIGDILVDSGTPALVAITKVDKVSRNHRRRRCSAIAESIGVPESQCLLTSSKSNEGVGDLVESIEALVHEER